MWGNEFQNIRLLIAMEHEQMREGFKQIVKRAGADHVASAVTHKDAVAAMQGTMFNMFIVEDTFPDQGGVNFARYVRLIAGPMSVAPIVLGLYKPSKDAIFEARDAGVNAVTALPMNTQVFTKTITGLRDNVANFVRTSAYNGPDRRKKAQPVQHADRRRSQEGLLSAAKIRKALFENSDDA